MLDDRDEFTSGGPTLADIQRCIDAANRWIRYGELPPDRLKAWKDNLEILERIKRDMEAA